MAYEAAATIGMQALSTAGSGLFAKSQAAKNRRFIKRQQTHGIRRRVKDLRKAGINPIAAADGAIGGGGGGVSGGIATMPDANLGQVMNTARDAGSKKNAEDGRKTSSASTKPCDQCTNNRDQEARNQNGKRMAANRSSETDRSCSNTGSGTSGRNQSIKMGQSIRLRRSRNARNQYRPWGPRRSTHGEDGNGPEYSTNEGTERRR